MSTTIIIGYSRMDLTRGYIPAIEGWRPGARQDVVTIEATGVDHLSAALIAEMVFTATNEPDPEAGHERHLRGLIEEATDRGRAVDHFSLSVGDTVTVDGARLAVLSYGYEPVEQIGRQ